MLVRDVTRCERTDREADDEIADDRGEAEPARADADESRDEQHDADLEDGQGLFHARRLRDR